MSNFTAPNVGKHGVEIVVVFSEEFSPDAMHFRNNRIILHGDISSISSSGVQMMGIAWPCCKQTRSIIRLMWAFAKCLQFQVNK